MTTHPILAAAVLAAALTLGACTAPGSPAPAPGAPASAAPASGSFRTLDAAAFAELVARPGTVVLDVRTPAEYASGHLEDAVNVDVQAADFSDRIAELDPAAVYAVYCRSGSRSAAALATMRASGFSRADHLGGGIAAWQAAGLPVVR